MFSLGKNQDNTFFFATPLLGGYKCLVDTLMDEYCVAICGEWVCPSHGKWQFVVDKHRFSRVVMVRDGVGICELRNSVLKEFGEPGKSAALSYWPPNSYELATRLTTPPVLLNNDGGVVFFLKHVRVNKAMNLFVTITRPQAKDRARSTADVSGFTTPVSSVKRFCMFEEGSSSCKSTPPSAKFTPVAADNPVIDSVGSRSKAFSFMDDVDDATLVSEVEKIEESIKSGFSTGSKCARDEGFVDGEVGSDSDEDVSPEFGTEFSAEFEDVRPLDYDKEFWVPLINNPYGGSDAAEVITNTLEDGVGGVGGARLFSCSTGDAFDHFVVSDNKAGGRSVGKKAEMSHKDEAAWSGGMCSGETNNWGGGQRDVDIQNAATRRRVDEIDDEEFDIPPLFDDTLYERADIPDLDRDEKDERVYIGKVFDCKVDCQIALAIYAIKERFHFKQTTTKRHYFVLTCVDERCGWRIMAGEQKDTGYYQIKKANLEHSCDIDTKNGYKKKATSRVIAAVYKSRYGPNNPGPLAMDLQQLVLEDLRLSASYMKCYRAKAQAVEDGRGTEADSYLRLPEYMHCLKLANPGTVADLETEKDEDGKDRFLYAFLAFGASIHGFRKLRRLLVLDGTHLSGKYKGVLLTASGQDANFQVFPLAFAVVDNENDDAWTWFLRKVEQIVPDSKSLTLISDRHCAIYSSIAKVYPLAHHGCCIVHLQRNVNSIYKRPGLAKLVGKAAYAIRVGGFRAAFKDVESASRDCAVYLEGIGIAHWCRAYFQGNRYNLMTSNIAETLNNALKRARSSPIHELFMFIQSMMTRWFSARRTKSLGRGGKIPPEVEKQLELNKKNTVGSKVCKVEEWGCEIIGKFTGKYKVCLTKKECTCRYYDKIKLPCGHALIAADYFGVSYGTIIGDWYTSASWVGSYEGVINPECDAADHDMPNNVTQLVLHPPDVLNGRGRRKRDRYQSIGEISKPKTPKAVSNRCGICKVQGHNRTSCKEGK